MDLNDQHIALAKHEGYKIFRADGTEGSAWCQGCRVTKNGEVYVHTVRSALADEPYVLPLPEYGPERINKLILKLPTSKHHVFIKHLGHELVYTDDFGLNAQIDWHGAWDAINATPDERRVALLKTLELWNEPTQ